MEAAMLSDGCDNIVNGVTSECVQSRTLLMKSKYGNSSLAYNKLPVAQHQRGRDQLAGFGSTGSLQGLKCLKADGSGTTVRKYAVPGWLALSVGVVVESESSSIRSRQVGVTAPTYDTIRCKGLNQLSEDEQEVLGKFLREELPKFDDVRGKTTLVEHKIRLIDNTLIKQRYYTKTPVCEQQTEHTRSCTAKNCSAHERRQVNRRPPQEQITDDPMM
ncbi:hypothetical protein J6590_063730 [Homalodisca vitripennis]|nr:hypothetical protein J6590_063730 [Homalodisca vitripennis]